MTKNYNTSPLSPNVSNATPNTKLYKSDDIPLSISASLQSSMPRTRVKKNNHSNGAREKDIMNTEQHQDSNDSNDDEIDYTHNKRNNVYYSTMNERKTTGHLHRNINNNSSTNISSTNRYRWHNQSDEIALHSLRNNRTNVTATNIKTEAMTMHSNHRSHPTNRKQHHLNQINNNFIISNKKQSIHNTNDDQHSIDQNNGNHYPSRLYH
ncbi:GATA zinc finger domain-containing protein 4-like [Contarinia nasturtii]|uniref:GATA zinc finger domain-containing protein 4-like n=1 Tax=Contarinia nasturtii TaxID=265458 RepID=UPI0012D37B5D|nr:GATA zinc finger domain-containing protein 4-like [Contarinia nasturtii]